MAMKKAIMNDKHIIKMAMAVSGCGLKKVAEKTGTSYSTAYNKIHKSGGVISLYTLYSVLHEMGFDIVIRDHDKQYGGVEYTLMEKQDGDTEWEKRLEHELVDAKHHVSTVKSMTKDGQIETVQVVNAVTEPKKQRGEQPFDFSLKKTDEQLELENAPTFKGKVIQTPDTAIKAAARIARLNDDSLFNK